MATVKEKPRNDALRLLGLPALPRKLPSRNWLIFWALTSSLSAAIVYDSREKRRATARWAAAVAPLAREPIPSPSALPRRVTVFLEAPPGDTLRAAQDHFAAYIKPVLASSGLDWDFVVGRQQGDVRAVVAERIRRSRRTVEKDFVPVAPDQPTGDDIIDDIRRKNGIPSYAGVKGDIIVGRHTWKEYVRGLHEGWLGPLALPEAEEPEKKEPEDKPDKPEDKESKPDDSPEKKRPDQLSPYNTPSDYPSSALPRFIPAELGPSIPVPFPHLLGFTNTPVRLNRFLNRRALADDVGRSVAAVCFGVAREFREGPEGYEQATVLDHEENDWVKAVWKEVEERAKAKDHDHENSAKDHKTKELIWASPVVLDSRIASRMRRFELAQEEEARARQIVVPEEKVEGWTKGKFRQLGRWAMKQWERPKPVDVGDVDS